MRFQPKKDTGVYTVRGIRARRPGRVCSSDVTEQQNQRRSNSGIGPHFLKKAALECQGRGNRTNEIPWTWHQGQLKERAGFLVSRSLTLPSAPPWAGCHLRIFPDGPKKKNVRRDRSYVVSAYTHGKMA